MVDRTDDPYAAVFGSPPEPPAAPVGQSDPYAALGLPAAVESPSPDTRPWYARAGQTVDDAVRAAANTITFGGADRLAGYMNSGGPQTLSGLITGQKPLTYDQAVNAEVAKSDAARARSPYASTAGDVAGAVALPGFGAEALAAKFGRGVLGRVGAYGTTGAGVGALQGAGNTYTGNLPDYISNAAMGGVLGGAVGGTLGGAFGPRPLVSAAKTPTEAETNAATDFVYNALRANKGFYENPHLATRADQLAADFSHYTPGDIPTSLRAIESMRASTAIPGGGNTPAEIERIRASINAIPKDPSREADRAAGLKIKQAIDDFYTNPPLGAVRSGTEAEAAAAGETADLARRLAKSGYHQEIFNNILHDAHLASQNPKGGPSFEDAVWAGVRGIEKADRPGTRPKLAGWGDAEKTALEKIAYPNWLQSGLRAGSKYLGADQRGIVNPFTLAAGGAGAFAGAGNYFGFDPKTSAIAGAALPLTGLAMRGASGRMANKAIRDAYDVIHQSNPLYDARVMTAGTKSGGGFPASVNDATRNAVTAAIVNQGGPTMLPPFTVEEGQ
jgi:hypothetical protein